MKWLFAAIMLGFAAWAVWRGIEAYLFKQMLAQLDGDLTDLKVQRVLDGLNRRNVPNAPEFWERLKALEHRIAQAPRVSSSIKGQFKAMLQAKGMQF